jgi:hypothetical protein
MTKDVRLCRFEGTLVQEKHKKVEIQGGMVPLLKAFYWCGPGSDPSISAHLVVDTACMALPHFSFRGLEACKVSFKSLQTLPFCGCGAQLA